MYDMINIFEVFLPQLLRYPNPSDPLNGEAAALLLRDPKNYDVKVKGMFLNISHPVREGKEMEELLTRDCAMQTTSNGTRPRTQRTKPAPRAKTTTTSRRWGALTTTTRRRSRRGRWTTYDVLAGVGRGCWGVGKKDTWSSS
jgi:hypothetical protein